MMISDSTLQTVHSTPKAQLDRMDKSLRNVRPGGIELNSTLALKWFEYMDRDAAPAKIEYWLDLVKKSPAVSGSTFNFEIRNYRMVPAEAAKRIIENVASVITTVAHVPPSVAYDPFEHHPTSLFLAVLNTVPPGRIRACVICDKPFRAQRKDRTACSKRCANVARQKRYRERWPRIRKESKTQCQTTAVENEIRKEVP